MTHLRDLQPTYIGVIIHVLNTLDIPVTIYFHTTLILFPSNKSFEDENPRYIAKHPALEKKHGTFGDLKKNMEILQGTPLDLPVL